MFFRKASPLFCVLEVFQIKEQSGWKAVPIPRRCEGCPYPRVGFVCQGKDGSCLRTDMEELAARRRSEENR